MIMEKQNLPITGEKVTISKVKKVSTPLHHVSTPSGKISQYRVEHFNYDLSMSDEVNSCVPGRTTVTFETIIEISPRAVFTSVTYNKHTADIAYSMGLSLINHLI